MTTFRRSMNGHHGFGLTYRNTPDYSARIAEMEQKAENHRRGMLTNMKRGMVKEAKEREGKYYRAMDEILRLKKLQACLS